MLSLVADTVKRKSRAAHAHRPLFLNKLYTYFSFRDGDFVYMNVRYELSLFKPQSCKSPVKSRLPLKQTTSGGIHGKTWSLQRAIRAHFTYVGTGSIAVKFSLSNSCALIYHLCFDLDDCLPFSQIQNNQMKTPWCSILQSLPHLLIQFARWNKYLFNRRLIWEISIIWVGLFLARVLWFICLRSGFFCIFFHGMFCEFDFKEFLGPGEHTAGNKQILSKIATSPSSTAILRLWDFSAQWTAADVYKRTES